MAHRWLTGLMAGVMGLAVLGAVVERACAMPEFSGSRAMSGRHACCPPADCDCKVKAPRDQATLPDRIDGTLLKSSDPGGFEVSNLQVDRIGLPGDLVPRFVPSWAGPPGPAVSRPILFSNLRF